MAASARSMHDAFRVAVDRVLNSWTVLKLAVSHGFGGADSQAKAEWMAYAIDQWFAENTNIETYELEDYLEDVLDSEFDTIADDGSLSEIARMICGLYKLCQTGEEEKLKEQLEKLPPSNIQACQQVTVPNCAQGDGNDLDPASAPPLVNNTPSERTNDSESMETDSQATEDGTSVEDDGWTTVSKKNKRR